MKYMVLIYEPAGAYQGPENATLLQDVAARHMALAEELQAAGVLLDGSGLQGVETATTVVIGADGRQTLHDGPFAETREHLGGYYLIDVPDLDAALAIARRVPGVAGSKTEVRPLLDMG
ncbi:conserved hypothetical protein [Phenylobacterium zucineum HLK1]|uniref:YCII-related domain-containing protein n=1 Tax=Phenylobacterium zucineum (strain HLK1) TaxID=450851 RepID=B4REZ6_PHEZH|nr:YciI family protein [Phenylobacterium zucineum]ACG76984.1 conserved hypothetical protein [Phenylobacterium zucineum HLK1]